MECDGDGGGDDDAEELEGCGYGVMMQKKMESQQRSA